jgi:hypothetical protein
MAAIVCRVRAGVNHYPFEADFVAFQFTAMLALLASG